VASGVKGPALTRLHVLATDGAFSDAATFHPLATWEVGKGSDLMMIEDFR